MRPETLEWALFLWPDWRDSIRKGREKFDVEPGMSWKHLSQWKGEHGGTQFTDFAVEEMRRLRLPREFSYYWMCCVVADFEKSETIPDFGAIRDFVASGRKKVYPRFFPTLSISPGVVAEEKDSRGRPIRKWKAPFPQCPTFKIEGFLHLIDGETLKVTIKHVMEAKRIVLEERPHPLASLIMKAKERVKVRDRKRQIEMINKYRKGKATIDDLLRDEYWNDETREGIRVLKKTCGKSKWRYRDEEKKLKKRVWDRVYRRIKRSGLDPKKAETKWWLPQ